MMKSIIALDLKADPKYSELHDLARKFPIVESTTTGEFVLKFRYLEDLFPIGNIES